MKTRILTVDENIERRDLFRRSKLWKASDKIRDYLDSINVFVFDGEQDHEVYYCLESLFTNKPEKQTKRQFLEKRIQEDARAEKVFDAWLYSINKTK